MLPYADMVVYDTSGQIVLIAEVKSRTEKSREWATQLRRNLLAHGLVPPSRFLLVALPDRLYLWKDVGNGPELAEPTYELDALPFFQPYYTKAGVSPDALAGSSFELIVAAWLNELVQDGVIETLPPEARPALVESGLLEALRGGRVALQVAA